MIRDEIGIEQRLLRWMALPQLALINFIHDGSKLRHPARRQDPGQMQKALAYKLIPFVVREPIFQAAWMHRLSERYTRCASPGQALWMQSTAANWLVFRWYVIIYGNS